MKRYETKILEVLSQATDWLTPLAISQQSGYAVRTVNIYMRKLQNSGMVMVRDGEHVRGHGTVWTYKLVGDKR